MVNWDGGGKGGVCMMGCFDRRNGEGGGIGCGALG